MSRSRSASTSTAMPTTRPCGGSWSSHASALPSTTCSPTRRPSTSTWSPADGTERRRVGGACRSAGPAHRKEREIVMECIDTVVIGAGHAGLAVSRLLSAAGHEHVVLERGRVGERWRSERWDSLHLLTPNWMTRLPGRWYRGPDPDGFMSATDFVGLLDRYAGTLDVPVLTGTSVLEVSASGDGYRVVTDQGTWRARRVVVATGPHGKPFVPPGLRT